jgi:hypothetical protein
MTPVLQAALIRAAWIAVPTGVLTALGTYQTVGKWTPALVAGGIALASVLLSRGGIEGWMDTRAATAAKAAGPGGAVRT